MPVDGPATMLDDDERGSLAALHEATAEYHLRLASIYRGASNSRSSDAPAAGALPTDASVYDRPDFKMILRRLMNETRSREARRIVRMIAEQGVANRPAWGHQLRAATG